MLFATLLTSLHATGVETIKVAASDFPPYFIYNNKAHEFDIRGFEVDLDREISSRIDVQFEYIPCPWIRCLKLLKEGDVDMASTILETRERLAFLTYIQPGYQLVNQTRHVYFYKRKRDPRRINTFNDLITGQFIVGVVRGDLHFPEFDQTSQIQKFDIVSYPEGLELLLKNKIDVVTVLETRSEWLEDRYQDKVTIAEFVHRHQAIVYRALSKKGKALKHKKAMGDVLKTLLQNGFIAHLHEKYRHQIR